MGSLGRLGAGGPIGGTGAAFSLIGHLGARLWLESPDSWTGLLGPTLPMDGLQRVRGLAKRLAGSSQGAPVMSVDKETVRRIARLARIDESEGNLASLADEMSRILTWVEQLGEVDTDHVAPMTSAVQSKLPRRDDVVSDGGYAEDIVKNAPDAHDRFFRVPKVVE